MIRAFCTSLGTRWALAWALASSLYAAGILVLGVEFEGLEYPVTEAILAVGAGLLVGLRMNFAYDRWWEGRKLWGTLVNVSRNLAVKTSTFAQPDRKETIEAATDIGGFAFALKDHLREGADLRDVPGFEGRNERPKHVPIWIAAQIYDRIHAWREAERLLPQEVRILDEEMRILLDVCGACERIRSTSMPPSLAVLTRIVAGLLLIGLPAVLIPRFGWWTVAAAAVVTFFVVIIETTASVIEHPFGTDPNQLDLDQLCIVIQDTTREALLGPPAELDGNE